MPTFSLARRPGVPGLAAVALAALLLGCGNSEPNLIDSYGWKVQVPTAGGGRDSVAFHWNAGDLPVKVWAEDQLGAPALAQKALDRWTGVLGSGKFRGIMVADSNEADIIVRVAQPSSGGDFRMVHLRSGARQCQGEVVIEPVGESRTVTMPMKLFIFTGFDPATPGVTQCLDVTMTHEMGHAIGLFKHSDQDGDVMYDQPFVAEPSYRDRATAQLLYESLSDLAPARP